MSVPRETQAIAEELFGVGLATAKVYAEALATAGVERGLIGPREVPRIWDRHLLNCVVLKELIPEGVELADVGSGAGLPGIPLAIARPDLAVHLVEPLLRRVVWLREVVDELGLSNVEIVRARAGVVAQSGRTFDVVTARAVAPLPVLAGWCLPLVRTGGEFLAIKGDNAAGELLTTESTLKALGAAQWSVDLCGVDVLETPTTAVRVVAGQRTGRDTKPKSSKTSRPSSGPARVNRPGSSSGRHRPSHG
jgi:16S rRNA (guanine527-N7)-methyltransferase